MRSRYLMVLAIGAVLVIPGCAKQSASVSPADLERQLKDREQTIRYDLMVAMIEGARADDSIDLARQAKTICSDIARKDITYRDIRAKRREVDELIKSITGD